MSASRLVVDRVTIKRGTRVVIDELSVTVEAGEIVGVVGANGCGKSTLLSCIAGVLAPHDGRIEIVVTDERRDPPERASSSERTSSNERASSSERTPSSERASSAVPSSNPRASSAVPASSNEGSQLRASVWGSSKQRAMARRAMGYVPEGADPPGFLRAEELWALCAASRGVEPPRLSETSTSEASSTSDSRRVASRSSVVLDSLAEALGLDEIAALTLEKMSLGQRRRACLGAAFLGPPALLVLDEPDNGLDAKRLTALVDLVKAHAANGGATILASHDVAWLDQLDARRVAL